MSEPLHVKINELVQELDNKITILKDRGAKFAQARSDYETEKAITILKLRDEGYPVTIILDLVKGDQKVARLRLQKDVAETMYKSVLESIQTQKIKIRVLQEQMKEEWSSAGRG